MATQQYGPRSYFNFTNEDLMSFIQARTGKAPPRRKVKGLYIKQLMELDALPFRFLDLPPELRNLIYHQLLTLQQPRNTSKPYCWPQILATSKQIHAEAKGVLYAANEITLEISSTCWRRRAREYLYTCGARVVNFEIHYPHSSSDGPYDVSEFKFWPRFLTNIHNLKLVLSVEYFGSHGSGTARDNLYESIEHLLYSLCRFLREKNLLRTVDVVVEVNDMAHAYSERRLKGSLWPLSMIGKPEAFRFEGLTPEVEEHVREKHLQ